MMMQFFTATIRDFNDALLGLKRRPIRFLLSGIGIGIGVSAILAMLSISEGAKQSIVAQIESLGMNTIRIESIKTTHSQNNLSDGLNVFDLKYLQQAIGTKGEVSGYSKREPVRVQAKNNASALLIAATPEWIETERLQVQSGRPFSEQDVAEQQQVCILGAQLANAIQARIGDIIQFDNSLCATVGILHPRNRLMTDGTALSSLDYGHMLLVPLSYLVSVASDRSHIGGITISLKSTQEQDILTTAASVRQLLETRHQSGTDYLIVVPLGLIIEARKTQHTFALVMGVIAGLSLLVGGIGVMNVMLAHISEQTREIGLRMAVGASRSRIVLLYLWQSIQLTLISGLWGVFGGMIIAFVVQYYAGWPIAFSFFGLMIGPCSAVLAGVLFGLQPAFQAASISPAIALREN